MGELIFIGMGLYDDFCLSVRGQTEARICDQVFAELYTSPMPGLNIERLSQSIGKPVRILSREEVEEDADAKILSKARVGRVAFLVGGDPMVATTHVDLRLRAHKAGIATRIIHGPSITSAVSGASGLQSYKFGRTVTIPLGAAGALADSIYDALWSNQQAGLHSLILLEVDISSGRHVTIAQGLEQLLNSSNRRSSQLVIPETLVVGLARLGSSDAIVRAGSVVQISGVEFGIPPHCIILPGKLHFVEIEALQVFCGATSDAMRVRA